MALISGIAYQIQIIDPFTNKQREHNSDRNLLCGTKNHLDGHWNIPLNF